MQTASSLDWCGRYLGTVLGRREQQHGGSDDGGVGAGALSRGSANNKESDKTIVISLLHTRTHR